MPDIDWMELLAPDRTSGRASATRLEDAQVFFEVGDRVGFFTAPARRHTGVIEKLNPKRAHVHCGDADWRVPYAGLDHLCGITAEKRRHRAQRFRAVAAEARELMDRHGLRDWSLRFNGSRTKLGECQSRRKLILLSRIHAVSDPPERVTDTILHEIAHALAGPEARHGPAWKAVAMRLGATPKSCAPESEASRSQRTTAKAKFRAGDAVSFLARGGLQAGTIVRMNPKRAKVRCGDVTWSVPYARLRAGHRSDTGRPGD